MTKTISLSQLDVQCTQLVNDVMAGNEVVIVDEQRPLVRLVAAEASSKKPREFGLFRGQIHVSDDFDAPLPDAFWLGSP
jgi:antitoxin (DNA-binding transcriptional repressor) of toxin-antitoxin stability system